MIRLVIDLHEIGHTQTAIVGGKGAHLGELSRVDGISVPPGFCVTTDAFRRATAHASTDDALSHLSRLTPHDRAAIRALSAEMRAVTEGIAVPGDLATAVSDAIARVGEQAAYAVRSSATTEDLPAASSAGQQDSYLNVVGPAAILRHVSKCWASLFTERAVTYRLRHGVDHRQVAMAVVVQQMVFPQSAGVLFTADPVTGNRKVVSVEATFGLGEALASGMVNADVYQVRDGEVVAKAIGAKRPTIYASSTGGTHERALDPERQRQPALTDAQILRLAQLGRRIEAHFGRPQDVEWCLADDAFQIVQSRPITTLFPAPVAADGENHVYLSVGHQQVMTDAMKPLGISMRRMTAPIPMDEVGGRLFVDVTRTLASPAKRAALLELVGKSDPSIRDALQSLVDRGDFIRPVADDDPGGPPRGSAPTPLANDPAIVTALIEQAEASIAALKRDIRGKSGSALLDFILADTREMHRILFDPTSHQAIMAGMEASLWLNEHLYAWLGEKNAADTITQSAPRNVTSEMGLALLDVADVIRPHPQVVAFLRQVENGDFLNELPALEGGRGARDAILGWLEQYGMRGVGEMDITRPRWSERPAMLLPSLLSNIQNFELGEGARRFERGRLEASRKEQELLARLRALPDGASRAAETKRMIDRVRTFIGYREYPKYGMIARYFIYKQALMEEADRLVQARVLHEREDIFFLSFQELHDVVRTNQVDDRLIHRRKAAFVSYQALMPPSVLTSDGEAVAGVYRRTDMPVGALVGMPVSTGTVEGRARVVLDVADADLEAGDILVTRYTDPGWTPVFVAVRGMVTEVGSLMSHGAVIAREYGLPAVVGVANATRLIRDGQRIRVNATDGYVEILP